VDEWIDADVDSVAAYTKLLFASHALAALV
jgi:hypothetical protein